MIDVLPLKLVRDEDGFFFGREAVLLGKLAQAGLPVANGFVITSPKIKLQTVIEHYDFSTKEVFEQSLIFFKREIRSIKQSEEFEKVIGKHEHFVFERRLYKSKHQLWLGLLNSWIAEIREKIWKVGFSSGITDDLESKVVIFASEVTAAGTALFEKSADDVAIEVLAGKLHPTDQQKIAEVVPLANKKLFMPYEYEWLIDHGVKIVRIKEFTPTVNDLVEIEIKSKYQDVEILKKMSTKIYQDLSESMSSAKDVDGVFIDSGKLFNPEQPGDSYERLVLRLIDVAKAFPEAKVLCKLADISEGMGRIRGSLRLLHQTSLFGPLIKALQFVRHKKDLKNIHIIIPFVRSQAELMQMKRELAVAKLIRKSFLEIWLELATPENLINLTEYLGCGVDGVVINLDELLSHLNGFDHTQGEVSAYKHEFASLISFLDSVVNLLHKEKIPCLAVGTLVLNHEIVQFLVDKGVSGLIVPKNELETAQELLIQAEKKLLAKKIAS